MSNLSPGHITLKFNRNRDRQYSQRKTRESTRESKKRRINRKKTRRANRDVLEVLEGRTYKSGVQFSNLSEDTTPIPSLHFTPEALPLSENVIKNSMYFVFDLETSNIGNVS